MQAVAFPLVQEYKCIFNNENSLSSGLNPDYWLDYSLLRCLPFPSRFLSSNTPRRVHI